MPDLKLKHGKLKDFYEGKTTIRDHQGVEINSKGEKLDSYHRAYQEQQKTMKKFEKSKKEMICCVESHSESYSEDEFYPEWYVPRTGQECVKKFL